MKLELFRVIIAGCRDFNNYELLKKKCDHMLSKKKDTHKVIIVQGMLRERMHLERFMR